MPPDDNPARLAKVRTGARKLDEAPALVKAARRAREMLPGDKEIGDRLSTAGGRPPDLLARYLAEVTERPSAVREVGLAAMQVYQSLSESQGRGRGQAECAILFTDLVEFSAWALEAGDADAIELLRQVARAVEPCIEDCDGRVVKRLGDGHMAVFPSAAGAVRAVCEARDALDGIEVAGYKPRIRAGVHVGKPRKIGNDYLGVDVNIAARVTEAAGSDQTLVSQPACAQLDESSFDLKRVRRFKAKGAPKDLEVYAVKLRG